MTTADARSASSWLYGLALTSLAAAAIHFAVTGDHFQEAALFEDYGVVSRDECREMGGRWSPGGVWMTHVWLIDNPNGVFAEANPSLVAA
jgi:hypothetical protein